MYYVTFRGQGRFGNLLFQYLMCKLFTINFGHTYISENDFFKLQLNETSCATINEDNAGTMIKNVDIADKHIICDGYFQKSDFFIKYREKLIDILYDENNNDYWEQNNEKISFKNHMSGLHTVNLNPSDIVLSLRLDDFIQYPCKTSDIIPPQYYIEILEKMKIENQTVYIVCDNVKYDWEHKYIEHFKKWNPILIQNTLIHDIALMRDCNILIHSNSTMCWLTSFLSNKKMRVIPKTNFYSGQSLNKIEESDELFEVQPLDHDEVHNLNVDDFKVVPLSFSIPDECIVENIPEKEFLLAPLIPGDVSTYVYKKCDEQRYYDMYKKSRFAITKKKGGWDCLRHYEILMNGCIPLFENLKDCPENTMTTYPKHLNEQAYELYNKWQETDENIESYNNLCRQFLEHTRNFCTTSHTAKSILNSIKNGTSKKNILLITCDEGLNYTREFTWIGIKRYIQSIGGVAIDYPKINSIYKDYDINSTNNCCYTYSNRIETDYEMLESEVVEKIKNKYWDLIIYGKVGPDENCNFPLYNLVKTRYNRNKIAFLFGGDEPFNLKITDKETHHLNIFNMWIPYWRYKEYLEYYKQFGTCFVRELDM